MAVALEDLSLFQYTCCIYRSSRCVCVKEGVDVGLECGPSDDSKVYL